MSIPAKITDDEMRYFKFKARQLFLLRKESHEWEQYCKKNSCTCSSEQCVSDKVNKEVGTQSSPKKILPNKESKNVFMNQNRRTLPQALNEIKSRLEKIDLTLSGLIKPTIKESVMDQKVNIFKFPVDSDAPESVRSLNNEKRMKLIQNSLKMSLQRLQSSALQKKNIVSTVNEKKKSSGYFLPHDLEKQRTTARRMYLASLEKLPNKSRSLLTAVKGNIDEKKSYKSKLPKTIPKSRKILDTRNQKEPELTLIAFDAVIGEKDENIENIVDVIVDDLMGETVLIINRIKQMKSQKSSVDTKTTSCDHEAVFRRSNTKKQDQTVIENRLQASKDNENREHVTVHKYVTQHYNNQSQSFIDTHPVQNELAVHRKATEDILKCRKKYWDYLEKISRTRKGNFNPWILSNTIAESLLDDCIHEISQELQDFPGSLISELYDQEFVQSI